jgi:hypothetical protein
MSPFAKVAAGLIFETPISSRVTPEMTRLSRRKATFGNDPPALLSRKATVWLFSLLHHPGKLPRNFDRF